MITYYLGAGASAKALSTVNNMKYRIDIYLEYLLLSTQERSTSSPSSTLKIIPPANPYLVQFIDLINKLKTINEKAKQFNTYDTYAKSLFLRNSDETREQLDILKILLSSYFLFETKIFLRVKNKTISVNGLPINKLTDELIKETEKSKESINRKLDPRYESLLATILNTKKTLSHDLRFISWNYDNQLELAYKKLLDATDRDFYQNIGIFPDALNIEPVRYQLIKLNGAANFMTKLDHENDNSKSNPKAVIPENLEEFFNHLKAGYKPLFQFAWEPVDKNQDPVIKAIEAIKNARALIIIGYSFPPFNHFQDRKIFEKINPQIEAIFIHDLNPKSIQDRVESLIPNAVLSSKKIRFHLSEDTDQFSIPLEYLDPKK